MQLVSIIIPCYKQAKFLNETLESVYNQTYSNWECLIINDGSPDDTDIIANKWVAKDCRFRYFYKDNGGLSSARNFGLENVKGDFIQFLDSDDCLNPRKLELSINEIYNNDVKIVISNFRRFRKSLNKLKRAFCDLSKQEFTYDYFLTKWDVDFSVPIHCALFKKELIGKIKFDESLNAKEDWLFWLRVLKQNPKVYYINEVLVYYRIHENGMTSNFELMNINEQKAYIQIYDSLDYEYKSLFYKRVIKELSNSRYLHHSYKNNLFYKRIINYIRNIIYL